MVAGYQITLVIGSVITGEFFQVCGLVSLIAGYQITFVIGSVITGKVFIYLFIINGRDTK